MEAKSKPQNQIDQDSLNIRMEKRKRGPQGTSRVMQTWNGEARKVKRRIHHVPHTVETESIDTSTTKYHLGRDPITLMALLRSPTFLFVTTLLFLFAINTATANTERVVLENNWFDAIPSVESETVFPFHCTSNQQCIQDSIEAMDKGLLDEPLPFCWLNHECQGERQFALSLGNTSNDVSSAYPVFHQGDIMCATALFNPSLVLIDQLWPPDQDESHDMTLQQKRLVLFQTIPMKITIEELWMCSSKENARTPKHKKGTDKFQILGNGENRPVAREDVVPHTFIQHYDAGLPESTGCKSQDPSIRKRLMYRADQKNSGAKVYPSSSGLSAKVCFEAHVLGLPDVPCLVDAKVSIQLQRKTEDQDLSMYVNLLEAFGLNATCTTSIPRAKEDKDAGCVAESHTESTKKGKRKHGNRNRNTQEPKLSCPTFTPEEERLCSTSARVTSSETLAPHVPTAKTTTLREPGTGVVRVDEGVSTRTVGYYYYYDPEFHGYYYHHPHVHCDWDLTFDDGAGICEVPGKIDEDTFHVFTIVLAGFGFAAGLVFYAFDWKSRALFVH